MTSNGRSGIVHGSLPVTARLTTRAYVDFMRTASAACLSDTCTPCAG